MKDFEELAEKSKKLVKELMEVLTKEKDGRVCVCSLTTILSVICGGQPEPEKALEVAIESLRISFQNNKELINKESER